MMRAFLLDLVKDLANLFAVAAIVAAITLFAIAAAPAPLPV